MDKHKEKKIRVSPVYTNRASLAGELCERKLVYYRTRSTEAIAHSVELQYIFDEGNIQEAALMRELTDAGLIMVENQRPFTLPEYEVSGSIDFKLVYNGKKIPTDIKSMSPMIWSKMSEHHVKESLNRFSWTRKYIAQILLYCVMDGSDVGLLILKNKSNGQLKQMVLWLEDYSDELEELFAKLLRVNHHVKSGTLPPHIEDHGECNGCVFAHICMPNINTAGLEIINDDELESMLDTRESLKAHYDAYNDLSEQIKEAINGRRILLRNWVLDGKWITVNHKPKEATQTTYWRSTLKKAERDVPTESSIEWNDLKFIDDSKRKNGV